MQRRWPIAPQVATFLTAVVGVIVGHGIAYLSAYPDALQRGRVLHTTGHTYGDLARTLAVAAGAATALVVTLRGLRQGLSGRCPSGRLVLFRWLAPLQVLGFSMLEIQERLAAGAPLSELVHGHEFVVGLLAQIAVAAVAVLLIALTEQVAAAVAAAGSHATRRLSDLIRQLHTRHLAIKDLRWWSAPFGRGPPAGRTSRHQDNPDARRLTRPT